MQFAGTLRKSDLAHPRTGQFSSGDGARQRSPSRCRESAKLPSLHRRNGIVLSE
jgi:hypothetical protein